MTHHNDCEEASFDGSVSIPHLKFLWEVVKELSKELFTLRVTGVKVLTAAIFGLAYIPQLFHSPMHVSFTFSLRILYTWCWYAFIAETCWILLRVATWHRAYFCCRRHL